MIFNIQFPTISLPRFSPGFHVDPPVFSIAPLQRGCEHWWCCNSSPRDQQTAIQDAMGKVRRGPGIIPGRSTKLKGSRIQNLYNIVSDKGWIWFIWLNSIPPYPPTLYNSGSYKNPSRLCSKEWQYHTTPSHSSILSYMSSTTIHSSHTWIPPITSNMSSSCRLLNSFDTSTGGKRINGRKWTNTGFSYVFSWFSHQVHESFKSERSSLKISQTISSPALSSKPYCRIKSSTCASTLRRPSCQPSQPAVPAGGGGWPMGTPRLASTARMRERSTAEGLRGLPLKSFSMICCWTYFLGKFKKKTWKRKGVDFMGATPGGCLVSERFEKSPRIMRDQ